MHLEYVVSRGEQGWLVTANGIDCGIVADRETALRSAMRWARTTSEEHDRQARVVVDDGFARWPQWESGGPNSALRLVASAMRQPSAYFVRKLAEFRLLYISG